MKVQLAKLAHARSGDKGDTANVGLIALRVDAYPILVREVSAERVKRHFTGICRGDVAGFVFVFFRSGCSVLQTCQSHRSDPWSGTVRVPCRETTDGSRATNAGGSYKRYVFFASP